MTTMGIIIIWFIMTIRIIIIYNRIDIFLKTGENVDEDWWHWWCCYLSILRSVNIMKMVTTMMSLMMTMTMMMTMTLMTLSPSTLRTSSCCGATTSAPPSTGYMDSMMSVSCPRPPHCHQCHHHHHHQLDISKMSVTHHHFNINDHCHHCSNFSSQNPPIDLLIIVIDEPPQRPLRIWV